MPPSLRSSADGKAELHLRTDELRDALWAATDARKDLAAAERQSVAEDSWSKQTAKQLTVLYAELVQSEVDRYQAAKQTVTAYTAWQQGQVLVIVLLDKHGAHVVDCSHSRILRISH